MKVAVQGIEGSFSEMAAVHYLNTQAIAHYELSYQITSENVLKSINEKQCKLGIFAIENSTGGVVYESIYALAKYNCHIENFFSIAISQNLLVNSGVDHKQITAIHSHSQALAQCQQYLRDYFSDIPLVEEEDTAFAAKKLAQGKLPKNTAVIGNQACSKLYGLTLLEKEINDLKDNQTLFIAATAIKDAP